MPHRTEAIAHLQRIENAVSQETVNFLLALLKDAANGDVTGIAYVAVRRGMECEIGCTDAAVAQADLVIGKLGRLQYLLHRRTDD